MANKIVLKKSSVASRVPQLTDLDWGEVALNYADGRLYFKRSSNTIDYFSTSAGSSVDNPTTYTTTTVSQEIIDAVSASSFRSGKYEIQITSPLGFERVELTFIHDNTNVYINTSGIRSAQSLGTFSAQIGNGNVQIIFVASHIDTTLVFTKRLTAPAGSEPGQTSTLPEDLLTGSGEIDLQTGSDNIDLNGTAQPASLPQDLGSGSSTIDMMTGTDTIDLSL